MNCTIRNYIDKDYERILELNEDAVEETSKMDKEKLLTLLSEKARILVLEVNLKIEAFIIFFTQDAIYDNSNFRWFLNKYSRFIYIDRVIISKEKRGRKLGTYMYKEIIKLAKKERFNKICAEIYSKPPNIISLKFHEKFGFKDIGRGVARDKEITYKVLEISD